MAEIVNLRHMRKRKAREDSARQADENRIRHGRTKAEKMALQAEIRRDASRLDAHRREPSSAPQPALSEQALPNKDDETQ